MLCCDKKDNWVWIVYRCVSRVWSSGTERFKNACSERAYMQQQLARKNQPTCTSGIVQYMDMYCIKYDEHDNKVVWCNTNNNKLIN